MNEPLYNKTALPDFARILIREEAKGKQFQFFFAGSWIDCHSSEVDFSLSEHMYRIKPT